MFQFEEPPFNADGGKTTTLSAFETFWLRFEMYFTLGREVKCATKRSERPQLE